MLIYTLWIWNEYDGSPELLTAWDEYTIDANPEGYHTAKKGFEDNQDVREIVLQIPEGKITDAFASPVVEAGVLEGEQQ